MRRHDMAKYIHRHLGDNGEGGRLDYFGELWPNEGCAQQCVRIGVDYKFRSSIEAIAL